MDRDIFKLYDDPNDSDLNDLRNPDNINFVLGSGTDLKPIESNSTDFCFSFIVLTSINTTRSTTRNFILNSFCSVSYLF